MFACFKGWTGDAMRPLFLENQPINRIRRPRTHAHTHTPQADVHYIMS